VVPRLASRSSNRTVVNDDLTHLVTLKPNSSLTPLAAESADEFGESEQSEEAGKGKGGDAGEVGLFIAVLRGGGEGVGEEGADAVASADLLPLLVACDGSILG
jgi:hypothetical protein